MIRAAIYRMKSELLMVATLKSEEDRLRKLSQWFDSYAKEIGVVHTTSSAELMSLKQTPGKNEVVEYLRGYVYIRLAQKLAEAALENKFVAIDSETTEHGDLETKMRIYLLGER